MERTFVMVKPDGVQRGLVGKIITRFEEKGFKLVAAKFLKIETALAERHYAEHKGKTFFSALVSYITSGPVLAMVWEGPYIIKVVRDMMGKTNPIESPSGTIRGDFGLTLEKNVIHGSDSPESAKREISLFFKDEELVEYSREIDKWL